MTRKSFFFEESFCLMEKMGKKNIKCNYFVVQCLCSGMFPIVLLKSDLFNSLRSVLFKRFSHILSEATDLAWTFILFRRNLLRHKIVFYKPFERSQKMSCLGQIRRCCEISLFSMGWETSLHCHRRWPMDDLILSKKRANISCNFKRKEILIFITLWLLLLCCLLLSLSLYLSLACLAIR